MQKQIEYDTFPITEFASPVDPIDRLFSYPGERPEGSFITDGEEVCLLPSDYEEFYQRSDEILRERGITPMDYRIPVLSYGANAAPALLKNKMDKFSVNGGVSKQLQTVPHCSVKVPDSMAAWHGRPGQTGSTFAELAKLPVTEGVIMHAHVAFMTTEQLAIVSVTEGITYSLAEVEVLVGDDELPMKVLAYVALDSSLRVEDGEVVAVDKIRHSGKPARSKGPKEVVESMLGESDSPITNPIDYAKEGLSMTLAQKKDRQMRVGSSLDKKGSRVPYVYPTKEGDYIGRTDFVSASAMHKSPHSSIVKIPEMELDRIRPTEEAINQKVEQLRANNPTMTEAELAIKAMTLIDPARMLSRRAHDEIATRLNN